MNEKIKLDSSTYIAPYAGKNEDRLFGDITLGLFAVFDGSGKSGNGARAAQSCCEILADHAEEVASPGDMIYDMQRSLGRMASDRAIDENSATTALIIKIDTNLKQMGYGQVGSGVVALIRESHIERLTVPKRRLSKHKKHIIADAQHSVELAAEGKISLEPNDRVIITSNGVDSRSISSRSLRRSYTPTPIICAQFLVEASTLKDDKSVIVIDVQ